MTKKKKFSVIHWIHGKGGPAFRHTVPKSAVRTLARVFGYGWAYSHVLSMSVPPRPETWPIRTAERDAAVRKRVLELARAAQACGRIVRELLANRRTYYRKTGKGARGKVKLPPLRKVVGKIRLLGGIYLLEIGALRKDALRRVIDRITGLAMYRVAA